MITEAIILAGGLGTRLKSAVPELPKCMAPVNDIPFIAFVIGYLQTQGINHFIFSLGYKSNDVIDYLDKNYSHFNKTYVIEDEPLGTGGGIKKALGAANNNDVLIVNGDTIFKIDIAILTEVYQQKNADCAIALKAVTHNERYGTVTIDENKKVVAFTEKKDTAAGFINGGVYIINKNSFLDAVRVQKFSFEKDYLEVFLERHKIVATAFKNYFIDIGIPDDYYSFAKKTASSNNNIDKTSSSSVFEIIAGIMELIS